MSSRVDIELRFLIKTWKSVVFICIFTWKSVVFTCVFDWKSVLLQRYF